jgi:hypothetical protein
MRPPHWHRRELACRVMSHHLDFLAGGEEFGADAERSIRAAECSERSSANHLSEISMAEWLLLP